jgi:hypothetical protein
MSNIKLSLDLRTSWKSLKHNHKSLTLDYSSDLPHDMNNVIALTYLYTYCHLVFLCYLGCWITLVAYAKPSWEQFNKSGSTWRLAENLNISNVNHVRWSKGRQAWVRYVRQGKATRFSHDKSTYMTIAFHSLKEAESWCVVFLVPPLTPPFQAGHNKETKKCGHHERKQRGWDLSPLLSPNKKSSFSSSSSPNTPRPNDVQDLQQACNINEPKHGQTM